VVQICGVLPCLSAELLATPHGACGAERDKQKMDGEKISWETFFQTHEDARDKKIRTNSSGKTETPRREHSG